MFGWVDGWVGCVVDGLGDGEVACWVLIVVSWFFLGTDGSYTWSFDGVGDALWWWHDVLVLIADLLFDQ